MANTITNIYFSNTFGDLVRTSNNLVNAFNYLGYFNWDKPSGKFSLSAREGYGFEANTRSIFYYETLITGDGFLQVDNNAEVKKTLTLSNTSTSIMCLDARGIANINYVNVTNTASSMLVAGNSTFQKDLTVLKNTTTDNIFANNALIYFNLEGNVGRFTSNVTVSNFVSNNSIYANRDLMSNRNIYSSGSIFSGTNVTAGDTIYTNKTESYTYVNTSIVYAANSIYGNNIIANNNFSAKNISANNITSNSVLTLTVGSIENDAPTVNNMYSKEIQAQLVTTNKLLVSQGMSVFGDISYETSQLVLSSNTPIWLLSGVPSQFVVNRVWDGATQTTYSSNANAALFWSETQKRWRAVDVVNSPSNIDPTYVDILLRSDITSSPSNSSSSLIASANSVNIVYEYANSSFARTNSSFVQANSSFNRANNSSNNFVGTSGTAIPAGGSIRFSTDNGMTIVGSSNNVNISTPQDVRANANANFSALGVGPVGTVGTTQGEIRATNQIVAYYSDDRLKTKLGNIEDALDKVLQLNGFYYQANQTAQDLGYEAKREVGVSAQEVQQVLPEIIEKAPIDDTYMTVKYDRLIPLLVEAIKELKLEIDNLKK
jgi:Chaperone of endosialidase